MNNDIRNLSKWLNEEQETPIDRQALARVLAMAEQPAQQQEPVAWEYCEEIYAKGNPELNDYIRANGIPLYTTPQAQPQRKPLTVNEAWKNDELMSLNAELGCSMDLLMEVVEAIEAAHGITGEHK